MCITRGLCGAARVYFGASAGSGEEARARGRGAFSRAAVDASGARELVTSGDLGRLGGALCALQSEAEDEGPAGEGSGPGAAGRPGGGRRQSRREPLALPNLELGVARGRSLCKLRM